MNLDLKKLTKIAAGTVFTIAMIVYFFSAERTGSLWDCGEFILGAYKMQIVHPPGAPFFILVGRMFTAVADLFSNNPADIAWSVNLMSSVCTAFAAMFICLMTMIVSRLALVGRGVETTGSENLAITGAGIVAGLSTAFCTSIWFSAVEGEVYAMSTFFTAMTFWAVIKWYDLPDTAKNDRWLVFAIYAIALSLGVHLLSLLVLPALGLLYYFKKFKEHTFVGGVISFGIGAVLLVLIQKVIITGIPSLWKSFDIFMVNSLGLPFHSGIIPTVLILAALIFFGLRYAKQRGNNHMQLAVVSVLMLIVGYSTFGIVVIRANANPPINMNDPSDATRLLPYLNREQYGERELFRGPIWDAEPERSKTIVTDRYGRLGDRYEVVDKKYKQSYKASDRMLFNRMTDGTQNRGRLYRQWLDLPQGKPSMGDNIAFFMSYQVNWMYIRYFMWNFSGRQNGAQGYYSWDKKSGHWITGIPFVDKLRLFNQSKLTSHMKNNQSRNRYFMLPFLFGLIGFIFQLKRRKKDWWVLFAMFLMTGIGLIIYSNQPPNEPRERDYVLVGSFFTYCIWIGMCVPAIYSLLKDKVSGNVAAFAGAAIVLSAPILMGLQNFDDHSRMDHSGSRDYASNFLNSVDENAIIFTYGDNDTYPLWYAQEVENVRPDVRVVNLSLIAVDWYINQLRRKVNDSPAIKLTIPAEAYRGSKRIQTPVYSQNNNRKMNMNDVLKFVGEDHSLGAQGGGQFDSYLQTNSFYIPVNRNLAVENGWVNDSIRTNPRIEVNIKRNYLIKDELAVLDVIASNINDRPVYFSVTCQDAKLQGMHDYTQLEGLGLRVIPQKTKSNKEYFIYGSGKVHGEKIYDNIMNKFQWGNFDKKRLYVDKSYGASVQAHRMIMLRAAEYFVLIGQPEKADALADKFFEAFPNMNFQYDVKIFPFISKVYMRTKNYARAKEELRTLAQETKENLDFMYSLDSRNREGSFRQEFTMANQSMQNIQIIAGQVNDETFKSEMDALFQGYQLQQSPN